MTIGLWLAIGVLGLDLAGLGLDLLLEDYDLPSVTERVRTGGLLGWALGATIVAVNLLVPLGLAWHFWGSR